MPYTCAKPFAHSSGPKTAKIALVGEAHGEQEDLTGLPFVGQSGQELSRMLAEAGIPRASCFLTNTLAFRPPNNKLEAICVSKTIAGKTYSHAPLGTGKYLPAEYLFELDRLKIELTTVAPNLVVALGAVACWALLGTAKIGAIRGVAASSSLCPGTKILPTYHPSAVLRNWSFRPIVIADLMKAKREAAFSEIRRPSRQVLINPTLSEIEIWFHSEASHAPLLSCDIETGSGQIKCIGFATSRSRSIVIPFTRSGSGSGSYWPDSFSEVLAWSWVKKALELPCPKLFQNGLYDLQYLVKMGIRPRNCTQDTMLLHHSLFPEMQKGLGFLGSIYSQESAWKLMNRHTETTKRDE